MATITSLSQQGAFTSDLESAINTNFTNQNTQLASLQSQISAIVAGGFNATDSITAGVGGTQGAATQLTTVVNRVSAAATAGDSVALPLATAGAFCVVINDVSAKNITVYGAGTDTIDDVATATGVKLAATSMAVYLCSTAAPAGKWYSLGQWALQVTNLLANNILDVNGNSSITIGATASAVNGITVTNAATGNGTTNPVTIAPTGTDSAIGLTIAPKAAAGALTLGLSTGTADIVLGKSSGTQAVKIGDGAGAATVNIANTGIAGNTVAIAGANVATGLTDAVTIAGGNSAGTGAKTVTIAGGAPAGSGADTVNIGTGNAASTASKVVNIATGTPNTSGNNKVMVGGGATSAVTVNAVSRSYQDWNYIGTETGGNNALVAALVDAGGNNVTVAAGLRISLKLAHSLQAGANTLNLNGHGTDSIKKTSNPATDLSVTAVSGSILTMIFDGTVWQVQGQ